MIAKLQIVQPQVFLKTAITISFVYHGVWNLGETGARWWLEESHFPADLRYGIGVLEILISLMIWNRRFSRTAGLGVVILMIGAIFEHLPYGFSFKQNGIETPLMYFLMGMYFLFSRSS